MVTGGHRLEEIVRPHSLHPAMTNFDPGMRQPSSTGALQSGGSSRTGKHGVRRGWCGPNWPPGNRASPKFGPHGQVINQKRAYLSAHPPCAPGKATLSGILVPMGKPLTKMEFQVPNLDLAVPRLGSDATRWRRGARCCGVWCRAGWRLVPPVRARVQSPLAATADSSPTAEIPQSAKHALQCPAARSPRR